MRKPNETESKKEKKGKKSSFKKYLILLLATQSSLFKRTKTSLKEVINFMQDDIQNTFQSSNSIFEFELKIGFVFNQNKDRFAMTLEEEYRRAVKKIRAVETKYYGKDVKQGISSKVSKIFKEKAERQANYVAESYKKSILKAYEKSDAVIQSLRKYSNFDELEKSEVFKNLAKVDQGKIKVNFDDVDQRLKVFEGIKKKTFETGSEAEIKQRTEKGGYYEVKTTVEQTRFEIAKEQGETMKTWLKLASNENSRESHILLNGETIPIDSYFSVGNSKLLFPADLNGEIGDTINCLCTVEYD